MIKVNNPVTHTNYLVQSMNQSFFQVTRINTPGQRFNTSDGHLINYDADGIVNVDSLKTSSILHAIYIHYVFSIDKV